MPGLSWDCVFPRGMLGLWRDSAAWQGEVMGIPGVKWPMLNALSGAKRAEWYGIISALQGEQSKNHLALFPSYKQLLGWSSCS